MGVRYVDVNGTDAPEYRQVVEAIRSGRLRLPVVAIGGRVRYCGVFTPTFVIRDLDRLFQRAR